MLRNLQQNSIEIFFLFFFLNNHFFIVKAHIFIYAGCSQDKYTLNSPYVTNLNSLLSSITNSAPQALYNSFSLGNDSSTASSDGSIYGLYQCRGDLKTEDCAKCIVNVVSQIGLLCPYTYGAALQLDACFVRYDHFDFLGKLDISLRYSTFNHFIWKFKLLENRHLFIWVLSSTTVTRSAAKVQQMMPNSCDDVTMLSLICKGQ